MKLRPRRRARPVMGADRVRDVRGQELRALRSALREMRDFPGAVVVLHLDHGCHAREPCRRCVPLTLVVGARA